MVALAVVEIVVSGALQEVIEHAAEMAKFTTGQSRSARLASCASASPCWRGWRRVRRGGCACAPLRPPSERRERERQRRRAADGRRTLRINSQADRRRAWLEDSPVRCSGSASEYARDDGVGQVVGVRSSAARAVCGFLRDAAGRRLRAPFDRSRVVSKERGAFVECDPAHVVHLAVDLGAGGVQLVRGYSAEAAAAFSEADSASSRAPRTAVVRRVDHPRIGLKISVFSRNVDSRRKKTTQSVEMSGIWQTTQDNTAKMACAPGASGCLEPAGSGAGGSRSAPPPIAWRCFG